MEAFFADVKQWGVYADYSYTPNPDLKGVGNDHPFPPEIEVDSPYLKHRIQWLQGQLDAAQAETWKKLSADKKAKAAFDEWRAASRAFFRKSPDGWLAPRPEVALKMKNTNSVAATNFTVQPDGTVLLTRQPRDGTSLALP